MEGVVNDAVLCQGKVAAQLVWSEKKIKEEEEEEEGDEYTLSASTISLGERIGHLHTHTHVHAHTIQVSNFFSSYQRTRWLCLIIVCW